MQSSHLRVAMSVLLWASAAQAQETPSRLFAQPEAFKTLVNPTCSHCRDEARRRAGDLKPDDRVLCWIRGYSDGGAIPFRFLLNPYRVISDTYGVFVFDPDAGYARGFAPSLDFQFHGWRNGIMVMKHKDGTLYSCLSGIAFDGPKKGEKLKATPTLVSDWGFWLKSYPHAVAYQLFERYQPVELPTELNEASLKTRGKADGRLPANASVLGVVSGNQTRAYPLKLLAKAGVLEDEIGKEPCVLLWLESTRTASAYRRVASPPEKSKAARRNVTLERDDRRIPQGFRDRETGSRWDIAGRAIDGELKGWTLDWLESVQVNWFAWSAEFPQTTVYPSKD